MIICDQKLRILVCQGFLAKINLELSPKVVREHCKLPLIYFAFSLCLYCLKHSCCNGSGFMAPEYFNGVISTKSDLFSLGVIIIELMTGHRDYPQSTMTGHKDSPQSTETSFQHFIHYVRIDYSGIFLLPFQLTAVTNIQVVANWRDRLETAVRYTSLEIYSQQVYRCIEIGLNCVDPDPKKRPTACDIIKCLMKQNIRIGHQQARYDY